MKKCEAVDPSECQSGLAFNPDGLRSYYARSECFQEAAKLFRDESLCEQVKERWSLLWSSWGYSKKQCLKVVAEGAAKDRKILDEMKSRQLAGGVKLRDFSIERNGNRRDFDIVPSFDRGEAHHYTLRVEILGAGTTQENVTVAEAATIFTVTRISGSMSARPISGSAFPVAARSQIVVKQATFRP